MKKPTKEQITISLDDLCSFLNKELNQKNCQCGGNCGGDCNGNCDC